MRVITTSVAAVILAGCATSAYDRQQMPSKTPTAEYITPKAMSEAAACIETAVRAVSDAGHTVSRRQDGETEVVWVTTLANPTIAVRMTPSDGGTRVDYRSRYRTGYGKFTNAVLSCR